MKKLVSLFLCILIIFSFHVNALASENNSIYYLDDGSYIVTTITETSVSRSSNTKTGSKKMEHYSTNDELLWDATIIGTFTYNGTSATCSFSNIDYNIFNSNWKITSATATKNSNKAIGNITAKRYLLGVSIESIDRAITLTCSATGVLS